ncbi:photosystem reaction center subunit H [Fervidicella metallireducens AeB]|uniref:Photosystem reaction center subunit H n=1 Tax=Fervidicella metallireducens AeB TaxID=1403537 RepID=A0A017RYL2_9CLOT|nr:PRC-barrel domain-containing protein [Fervidicella metallireducens]EYE89661.1 photosystem reaction center subunit H [Fervidicella metallireducens AeB]
MKKYLDLRGINVVDEKGNLKGNVDDCIFDIKRRKIYSLVVSTRSFFSPWFLVSFCNISAINDSVIIRENPFKINKKLVKKNKQFMIQYYIGKEIIDTEGNTLGILSDLIFDEKSGYVKAIICSRGVVDDLIEGRRIIILNDLTVFGREKIIVEKSSMEIINNITLNKFK